MKINNNSIVMKSLYLVILFALLPVICMSQTNEPTVYENDSVLYKSSKTDIETFSDTNTDSLSTPLVAPIMQPGMYPSFSMYGISPFSYNYASWELHKGFNASLGMHVTFSPSKYAPSGAGFGQDAAFMYAVPVNSRFSVAAGLYDTNMNWGFINYRNVGIAGVAAFRLNDKITLYGYGNKSLMPQRSPMYYPLPNFSPDKFGGMINFKIGEGSSISFGVEGIKGYGPYYW